MIPSYFDSNNVTTQIEEKKDALGKLLGCIFSFYCLDEMVGDIWLIRVGAKSFESHSNVIDSYRGRGLGVFMYTAVADWLLEREFVLKSTPIANHTLAARRLWNSKRLQSRYQIKKISNRWTVYSMSTKPVILHVTKKKRTSARAKSSRAAAAARRL